MRRHTILYLFLVLVCAFSPVSGCVTATTDPSSIATINQSTRIITKTIKPNPSPTALPTNTLIPTKKLSLTETKRVPPNTQEASIPTFENQDKYKYIDPSGQNLLFWHHYTKRRGKFFQEIVDEFNANNEWRISVTAEYKGYYSKITKSLWEVLNTPYSPNIIMVYQNQAASYQLNNSLVDINTLLKSPEWGFNEEELADFFPSMLAQDISPTFDNSRLGFPPFRSMDILYYNIDWLAELGYDHPPSSLQEFKEMSCKAVEQPFSKVSVANGIGYELNPDASRLASWTFAHGGNIFDDSTNLYSYNSQEVQNAMIFIQNLINEGCAQIISEPYGDQKDFGNGKLLFTVGTSAGIPYYDQAVQKGANFRWNATKIPYITNKPVQNIYGVSFSIPKATAEKELAAWLFIKHFTNPAVQARWVEVSGYYPVRKSVAKYLKDYFIEYEAYHSGWEFLEFSTYEPSVPGYEIVRQIASEALATIANGSGVTSTLISLNEEANTILSEQMSLRLPEIYSVP